MVHLVEADPALVEAVLDGLPGEAGIVLLAGETLLLGGGHDPPVVDQSGRAVVIEGGDPEDAHRLPLRA